MWFVVQTGSQKSYILHLRQQLFDQLFDLLNELDKIHEIRLTNQIMFYMRGKANFSSLLFSSSALHGGQWGR